MQYRLGQIGLGVLGQAFAGHLLKANGGLLVYDMDRSRAEGILARGARLAESVRGVASECEVIVMALPDPEAVKSVMLGKEGVLAGAQPGTLVLDCSTIDPPTCREVYAAAKERGVSYLEAPVSGGEPRGAGMDGARAGNMTFMAAGDEDAFERAKPIMAMMGKFWFYIGPSGAGATIKLISNLMSGINNLVAAEGFVLGVAAGIPWEKMLEVFLHTDAKSFQMTDYMEPRMRRRDFEPGFSVDLQYKDLRLAGELAQQHKVPVPFTQLGVQIYQVLRAQGRGKKDLVDGLNLMAEWAGIKFFE
jgi:3-hydroxyisobutyrate dehydrogenase-like beta-hydroxyacid dehydrogenase